ncbi:protein-glutamine gamma-glutamyltransferase [Halobacillus sp. BBL2006]|uniref:protein-glutamine gamma-glutamyltransferase n=1 Tax=Halobacillus sp. BBL2006 TaxID=1543706 RepID=UPI000541BA3E|nr:protein-glutamine gamma-glutamyltransferase [Halobacillus sp. BBL2006]KHE67983.1 protein-glutamine gamma-glutamyltransferase [Halobacillus sp. BBL2006]
MIQVSGSPFQLSESWNLGKTEKAIVKDMQNSPPVYAYPTANLLLFELNVRKNIIQSAREMNESEAVFSSFRNARCNPQYWNLTESGGFSLKPGVLPADAIRDIFKNGDLYAFECATACVIIFYHAALNSIGASVFNSIFQDLYLYSWHTDSDLGLYTFYSDHYLPGDVVYFKNPDFSPRTPWFRGLNSVVMGDGEFFSHGVRIKTADQMIETLNKKRIPESNQSAYLTNLVTRPGFERLASFSNMQSVRPARKMRYVVVHHNKNSIPFIEYLFYLRQMINE